jgi:hypothetical protein
VLVALERRRVGHQHQSAPGRAVCAAAREPQVLADDQADADAIDVEHAGVAIRIDVEIAALVEHRVVGQFALAVGARDRAVAQHAGGVVDDAPPRCGQPTTATMPRCSSAMRCSAASQSARNGGRSSRSSGG